jgi:hypothetical protein
VLDGVSGFGADELVHPVHVGFPRHVDRLASSGCPPKAEQIASIGEDSLDIGREVREYSSTYVGSGIQPLTLLAGSTRRMALVASAMIPGYRASSLIA